jgi:hypothetical protein
MTNANIVTTSRATVKELLGNTLVCSEHKPTWVKFATFESEKYSEFHQEAFGEHMKMVHASLTDITDRKLRGLLTENLRIIIEREPHLAYVTLKTKPTEREGLIKVRLGDTVIPYFGTEADVYDQLGKFQDKIKMNSLLWMDWAMTGVWSKNRDKDRLVKLPNGMSVVFPERYSYYCQTRHNDEYEEHQTPYDFYVWLTKFF